MKFNLTIQFVFTYVCSFFELKKIGVYIVPYNIVEININSLFYGKENQSSQYEVICPRSQE